MVLFRLQVKTSRNGSVLSRRNGLPEGSVPYRLKETVFWEGSGPSRRNGLPEWFRTFPKDRSFEMVPYHLQERIFQDRSVPSQRNRLSEWSRTVKGTVFPNGSVPFPPKRSHLDANV